MKKFALPAVLLLGVTLLLSNFTFTAEENEEILAINAAAPKAEVSMKDVSGKEISLDKAKEENGLLVIFSCNTCPFVIGNGTKSEGWQGRYPELAQMAKKNNIGFIMLNSNEGKRDAGDSMDDMKKQYKEQKFSGYYAIDKNHELADAFGALTTPHVFLFDSNMKLVYKGAIDDNANDSKAVKAAYLKDAMQNMVAGKTIEPNSTRQLGCSIKRVATN